MIRHLSHSKINFRSWDECIRNAENGLIYGYSWYLDIACPGWSALVYNDYEAVMPLSGKRKYFTEYLSTPNFVQQLGVFGNRNLRVDNFLEAIPAHFRLIEYNFNTQNKFGSQDSLLDSIQKRVPSPIMWLTHHLSLENSHEITKNSYDRTLNNNLKKAINAKLSILKNSNIDTVIKLFRDDKGKEVKNWTSKDYRTLAELITSCVSRGLGCVWMALKDDKPICGAAFVWSNNHYIFLFSGNTAEGRSCGALAFLLDAFIQEKSGEKSVFDFEGSNNRGLARFYKSFGAEEVWYPHIKWNRLPILVKMIKR